MALEERDPIPPEDEPIRRRPVYYPAGWGCLFWLIILFLIWIFVGLWWRPLWWPWWW